ncbi:hypothetical protein [Sphingosinicella sp. BN140058]|uniref:hypothetical protein n=1 Tax=Sphingosinicella sp. BN140058 TaxID=1892855 RepID=UPI0010131CC0|nr:hypothetical protein [Sphingosinicella sp. BN140058]QAY80295.1 hypothetical protein ETR14_27005 [Sphingosinicella sp. BN140058]
MKRKMMGAMLVYGKKAEPVVERCLRENKIAAGKVNHAGAASCMDVWIKKQGYRAPGRWGKD